MTEAPEEEWRPVEGYSGYEVSSLGQVRSLARSVPRSDGRQQRVRPRVLAPAPNKRGYLHVTLCRTEGKSTRLIHQLVCAAWNGPRPPGKEARHVNGDQVNNAAANLRWGTKTENILDRVAHGRDLHARRERCPTDHPLRVPNLLPSGLKRGCRECLACNRARSYCRIHPELEFRATADAYYAAIIQDPR